ncbi:MAG: NAD(P)H-dependent glycerol-3-phosphate dehydrogenase, partial [Chromatiales bacterium]|nr:NAD(P)H-dependent glycerol-3-phosphate dehydrogenase [Chromatiales bacterium]
MGNSPAKIAVLGAGSWGTALAVLLARNGAKVLLWGHHEHEVYALQRDRENCTFLPGTPFPDNLDITADLQVAVSGSDAVLVVVPSHAFAEVLTTLKPVLQPGTLLSWATKGLEPVTGRLLHEVAEEIFPGRSVAVVAGPSFAKEVGKGRPTAITVASSSQAHAESMANYLHSDYFRAYTSQDIIGLEIGG